MTDEQKTDEQKVSQWKEITFMVSQLECAERDLPGLRKFLDRASLLLYKSGFYMTPLEIGLEMLSGKWSTYYDVRHVDGYELLMQRIRRRQRRMEAMVAKADKDGYIRCRIDLTPLAPTANEPCEDEITFDHMDETHRGETEGQMFTRVLKGYAPDIRLLCNHHQRWNQRELWDESVRHRLLR